MIFPFFSVMYIIKRSESVHMILVHVYYVDTVISRQETYLYAFDDFKRTRCADCANLSCHLCITLYYARTFPSV